jgi:hypothetical protein
LWLNLGDLSPLPQPLYVTATPFVVFFFQVFQEIMNAEIIFQQQI